MDRLNPFSDTFFYSLFWLETFYSGVFGLTDYESGVSF